MYILTIALVLLSISLTRANTECRGRVNETVYIACATNDDGFFRSCNNCRDYFRCTDGIDFRFTCPENLIWADKFGVCQPEDETVKCNEEGCGPLPTVDHGKFLDQGNHTALLKCDDGYKLGEDVRGVIICTDGRWDSVDLSDWCEQIEI